MTSLYFAYGSNLHEADFRSWCSRKGLATNCLRRIAKAYLPDEALAFSYKSQTRRGGVLNIRPFQAGVVEGYLYEVSGDGWSILDRKEGAPNCYRRETVTVLDANGSEIQAATYRVVPAVEQAF